MSTSALSEALPASTPTRLLIGGEWIQTAAGLNVINPASYGTLATIGDAGVTEGFKQLTPRMRHSRLGRSPRLESERKSCAKHLTSWSLKLTTVLALFALENGKAWRDAMGEALYAAEFFRWFSEEAPRVEGGFRYAPNRDKTIITDYRPWALPTWSRRGISRLP